MHKVPIFWRYVLVFLVSMVPVIELRGAVPIGIGWGLATFPTYIVSIVGNLIPVPFILLFIRAVLRFMHTKKRLERIAAWIERKADKHKDKVTKYATFGLFLFVAIPFPGTGAWTGALIAALLNMRFSRAILSISLGVVTAGLIMTFGSELVKLIF